MSFKAAFARIFGAGKPATEKSAPLGSARRKGGSAMEQGFLVFEQTGDVISAERLLRKEGFAVEVKAPPAALRKGCDMVVVCPIMAHLKIRALLEKEGLHPLDYVPVSDPLLGPVSLFQVTDFGKWFMVRASKHEGDSGEGKRAYRERFRRRVSGRALSRRPFAREKP